MFRCPRERYRKSNSWIIFGQQLKNFITLPVLKYIKYLSKENISNYCFAIKFFKCIYKNIDIFYRFTFQLKSKAKGCKHPCKKQLKHFLFSVLCNVCSFYSFCLLLGEKKNPLSTFCQLLTACCVSVVGGLAFNGDKTDIMYLTSLFQC